MPAQKQSPAVTTFRKLHQSGCFLLPNPWDVGTAKVLHHLGFEALASTSAGFAFSHGKPDTVTSLTCDDVLHHVKLLVEATPLPVNADFQNGYASELELLAANVTSCVRTGAAGLSLEDATGDVSMPLYDRPQMLERLRTVRAAIDASGAGILLTARCEALLLGVPNARQIVLDRLPAYAEAGAECLFAPGVSDLGLVADLVRAVAPKPLNVLVARPMPGFTVQKLAELGVRRISLGSALSRLAMGAVMNAAKQILETGEFDALNSAASFEELNNIFAE